jgi:hypothetical protein
LLDCFHLLKNLLNLIFDLSYINITRGFHCDDSIHTYSIFWTDSLPPLYSHSSSPPHPVVSVFGGFYCAVFICVM